MPRYIFAEGKSLVKQGSVLGQSVCIGLPSRGDVMAVCAPLAQPVVGMSEEEDGVPLALELCYLACTTLLKDQWRSRSQVAISMLEKKASTPPSWVLDR